MNRENHYYGRPLNVSIKKGVLTISVGVNTLAYAVAFADWANPCRDVGGRDEYVRDFAIIDPEQFAKDVASAMLHEREDGSTPLSDFFDKAAQDAVEDGSLGTDDAPSGGIIHGTFADSEQWSEAVK